MKEAMEIVQTMDFWGARIANPLPVVLVKGEGVWVTDVEGNRYLDMLAGYSVLNQGHRHPHIINALMEQAQLITLTSRLSSGY